MRTPQKATTKDKRGNGRAKARRLHLVATAWCTTGFVGGVERLHRADEGTHELAVDLRRHGFHVKSLATEKIASIFHVINARRAQRPPVQIQQR